MRRAHGPTTTRSRFGRTIAATGAALLLVAGAQAFAPAASAASVEPTAVAGNPKCSGAPKKNSPSLGYDHGAKIDGVPEDGVDQDLGNGFTVTIENADDFSFDFKDATPDVLAVIVKASDKAYVYEYDPAVDADQDLLSVLKDDESGDRHQISHVEFCWDDDDTEEPSSTVAKLWFDGEGEVDDPPNTSNIVVTVTPDGEDAFTLDHDDLTDDDGIVELDHDAEDLSVDETTVPDGWDEFTCPEEYDDVADFVFCNEPEATVRDTDITVKKLWFDRDGDEVDAPTDSDIVITVDVTEGTDETLEHDDLDDGVVTVGVAPTNVSGVDETTVPDGWDEITCAEQYEDDADYVFCNRRESSNRSRGGGSRGTTTTTTIVTEVLPFTAEPEPEVAPEVLPETIATAAPQLPFTGGSSIRLAAVATALLGLGATLIAGGRRRPETID